MKNLTMLNNRPTEKMINQIDEFRNFVVEFIKNNSIGFNLVEPQIMYLSSIGIYHSYIDPEYLIQIDDKIALTGKRVNAKWIAFFIEGIHNDKDVINVACYDSNGIQRITIGEISRGVDNEIDEIKFVNVPIDIYIDERELGKSNA